MAELELEEIKDLQAINGILFPKNLKKRRLIITGPPGVGKSTLIRKLRGWPDEGYLDLSEPDWWRSKILAFRPREIHFGLPFVGHPDAVPVYETDILDDSTYLELDLFRIHMPTDHFLVPDPRKRLTIEFLLPPADTIFAWRKKRSANISHPVDHRLTLNKVREERQFYLELARYFHQNGFEVIIRDQPDGPPKRIPTISGSILTKSQKSSPGFDYQRLRHRILNRSWSERTNRELVNLFVQLIPQVLHVERCSIFINDRNNDTVWLQAGTHVSERQIETDKHHSVVGQVIAQGEYIVQENMDQIAGPHKEIDALTGFTTRNELCVPIKSITGNQQANGAILVLNKFNQGIFQEEDRIFLETVARHLETALESLYLRQEKVDFSDLLNHSPPIALWQKWGSWGLLMLLVIETVLLFLIFSGQFPVE